MRYPEDYINKVICGDCLEVMKGIPDKSVDLVLTDPPFNSGTKNFDNDKLNNKEFEIFRDKWMAESLRISQIGLVTFIGTGHIFDYPKPRFMCIWLKLNALARAGNIIHNLWEPINFYGESINLFGDVFRHLDFPNKCHPAQKPIKLISEMVIKFAKNSNLILDPFLGSGTTAVACKQLGRRFIGIEINPDYCKIAEQRLAQEVMEFSKV